MHTLRSTTLIDLLICGDPVTCKALVLILQGPDYNARYLCASSLNEVKTLEGVQILLLAPGWVAELLKGSLNELEAFMSSIKIPTLELVAALEERGGWPRTSTWPARRIPWPCSTDELKRHIRAVVASNPNMREGSFAHVTQTANKAQTQDAGGGQEQSRSGSSSFRSR